MYYKTKHLTAIGLLSFLIFFLGCKKYPENNLWFKAPEKTFKGGIITSFTANGQDLMPYYKNLYSSFPYNFYGQAIPNVFDLPFTYSSGSHEIENKFGKGILKFSETKREVEISFTPINENYGAESIFLSRLSWKVIKLTKSGQLKIEADYKFKKHQIQFN